MPVETEVVEYHPNFAQKSGGTKSPFCTLTTEVESAVTTGSWVAKVGQKPCQAIGDGRGVRM
jgi:hypothetical protein